MDYSVYRSLDSPVYPFKIDWSPLFDNRNFKAGLHIDRVKRPGINAVLDDTRQPEPDAMFRKFNLFYPDAKPDRAFFCLLGPYFIGSGVHAPESCGKNEISSGNKVPEMPEIIDALRE